MKAWDYNAVVTDDGCAVYCVGCVPAETDGPTHPIFAADERDSYPVCDACGQEHDYMGLTTCGEEIRAAVLAGRDW